MEKNVDLYLEKNNDSLKRILSINDFRLKEEYLIQNFYTLSDHLHNYRDDYLSADFTDLSTEKYFKDSLNAIDLFLKHKYKDDYLFSSIAYNLDDKIRAIPYLFNFPNNDSIEKEANNYPYIKELINYFTQILINEKKHLSFTKVMLSGINCDNPIKVLLFNGDDSERLKDYKPHDLIEFDLGKPKWTKLGSIEKFKSHDFLKHDFGFQMYTSFENDFGNPFIKMCDNAPNEKNIEEFNRLVSIYLELNASLNNNCYFYFIKPHSSHDQFSGVLLLVPYLLN